MQKVFNDEGYPGFVRDTTAQVLAGGRDGEFIYRKRLRHHLHKYQKNVPPHVLAACKYESFIGERLRRSTIDYQHYSVDQQLTPVADSILHFMDESLDQLVKSQLSLFDK